MEFMGSTEKKSGEIDHNKKLDGPDIIDFVDKSFSIFGRF